MATRHRSSSRPTSTLLLLAAALGGCGGGAPDSGSQSRNNRLVASLRSEPTGLDPFLTIDGPSVTVMDLLNGSLISFDEVRQEPRLDLAESLDVSADGRVLSVRLRPGLRFSDGTPCEPEDVLSSFAALLDAERASPLRPQLIVDGRPVEVSLAADRTLRFELAAPVASVERLLDGIPILARGMAAASAQWSLATPPDRIAGMGPFRFRRHVPGQRIELERNPHYWRVDAAGGRLPYLDELVFQVVASPEAEVMLFSAGEIDVISSLSAHSFEVLERHHGDRVRMWDVGPGLRFMFLLFNLNESTANAPSGPFVGSWFRRREFRQAVSLAVDREAIARLVFRGRAVPIASHETPGSRFWWDPVSRPPPRSLPEARRLLERSGFSWGSGGRLLDPEGRPVELTALVSAKNPDRPPAAELIREDLRGIGVELNAVSLTHGALVRRVLTTGEFDAAVLELGGGDPDPNAHLPILLSSGRLHLWQLAGRPLFGWERTLDELMLRQLAARAPEERRRLYVEVQRIVAEQLPFVPLVSPHVLVGARRGLLGFEPAATGHPALWNADTLRWESAPP
jgi:peptide/nickel transport system substrate-binding protein